MANAAQAVPDWYNALPDAPAASPSPAAPASAPPQDNTPPAGVPQTKPEDSASKNGKNVPAWYNSLPDAPPEVQANIAAAQAPKVNTGKDVGLSMLQQGAEGIAGGLAKGAGFIGDMGIAAENWYLNRGVKEYFNSQPQVQALMKDPNVPQAQKDAFQESLSNMHPVQDMVNAGLDQAGVPYQINREKGLTGNVVEGAENAMGITPYTPQTRAGEMAGNVTGFLAGGKAMGAKTLPTAAAAVASEAGGQATRGTPYEVPTRMALGMGGAALTDAGMAGVENVKNTLDKAGIGPKEELQPAAEGQPALTGTQSQIQQAVQGVKDAAQNSQSFMQDVNQAPTSYTARNLIGSQDTAETATIKVARQPDGTTALVPLAADGTPGAPTDITSMLKNGASVEQAIAHHFTEPAAGGIPNAENVSPVSPFQKVPGSQPTLGEVTSDQGIAQMQNALRQQTPEIFQRAQANNQTARAQALHSMLNEGDPQAVGAFFVGKLQASDEATLARQQALQAQAQGTAETSQQQMSRIGKYGELPNSGESTGDMLLDAQAARKEAENAAWKPLDPYMSAPADKGPVIERARANVEGIDQLGQEELHPVEKKVYGGIMQDWPQGEVTFQNLKNLRTTIGDAQSEVTPGTKPMRRLQMLKTSVDEAIDNTVQGIIHKEAQNVAAGQMPEEHTLAASMQKDVNDFYVRKAANTASSGGNIGQALRGKSNAAGGYQGVPGVAAPEGAAGGRPGKAARNQGVSEPELAPKPKFGEQQQEQYAQARSTTQQNRILDAIERSGAVNPDGTLNAKKYDAWYAKNKKQLSAAPDLMGKLQGARASLEKAESAQESLEQYRAQQAQAEKEFQKTRAAAFVKNDPVNEVSKIAGSKSIDQKQEFTKLMQQMKSDPDALAGMRTAVSKYIVEKVANSTLREETNATTGASRQVGNISRQAAFRDFIRNNKPWLKVVYEGGQNLNTLEAVGEDILRNQEFERRANIAGQSNTTKNAAQMGRYANPTIFGKIMRGAMMAAGGVAGATAGHTALGAWMGEHAGKMISSFKSAGLDDVRKIQNAMFENADFGRAMLQRPVGDKIPVPLQSRIGMTLMRQLPFNASRAITAAHNHVQKGKRP